MNISRLLAIFITCCLPILLHAQKVKLVNSTRQDWAGGIAGHRGTRYMFAVEFSDFKSEPIPDTLWLGHPAAAFPFDNKATSVKLTRSKNSLKVVIMVGTSHDDYADWNPEQGMRQKSAPPTPPVPYKGVALLSFSHNGKRNYFEIKKIMETYPQVNYP